MCIVLFFTSSVLVFGLCVNNPVHHLYMSIGHLQLTLTHSMDFYCTVCIIMVILNGFIPDNIFYIQALYACNFFLL